MPEFQHDRASIHYDVAGEGAPLLLIAGSASDGASWGPLLPLLRGRKLILIDNRGSGGTKVGGPHENVEMAEDCAALLDHLGLEAVDVVGHSLGGALGLMLASRHPARVNRLVTMGAAPFSPASRVLFHDLARLYFTVVPQDWFRILYQFLFSDPFFADEARVAGAAEASTAYPFRQSPGDFARQVAALDRMGPIAVAASGGPTLASAGELDVLARPAGVASMHAPGRDSRVGTIAGAAHSIHREMAADSVAAINEFLS